MNRYTNYDELLREASENTASNPNARCNQLLKVILDAPIADVVEVVRCRDCRHSINSNGRVMCKRRAEMQYGEWLGLTATEADNYCSYGERSVEEV